MSSLEDVVSEAFGETVEVTEPVSPETVPTTGEASEDGTPQVQRDEQGRFAPRTQEDPDVNRYLERFGGDVDKALRAAVEADSMIGRQGQQMGELQKQLTDIQQAVTQPEVGAQITQETVDWFDEHIDANPQQAAAWALQNDRTGTLYNRAMEAWFDVDPRRAASFETDLKMSQLAQGIQQQQQPLEQMAMAQDFAHAWNGLRSEIPDLDTQSDAILRAIDEAPEVLAALQSGTPESKQRVIRNLYKLSKFEQANQLAGAPQAQGAEQTAQQSAFVASGSQFSDPNTKSAGEKWAEENLDPELERYSGVRPW